MRAEFVDLGVKRVVGYVNSDGGGPGFMVKVTKQGLSLEANSYPFYYYKKELI